jgi:predicted oxidoreductase (fatty acid repression mutant protein)
LADPGDIAIDDIKEFISLSSAREGAARKEKEEALARDKAQVAEIKATQARTSAAQARTARLQRITRWAVAAVAAVILMAGGIIGWLQWDKAQQLARREILLTHARANLLGELAGTKVSRGELDSALLLALHGTRIDLALPPDAIKASSAAAALAAAVSQTHWRFVLVGYDTTVVSAAFSTDGSHIVTASADKTARIWDAATAKKIAVLRGHDDDVASAAFNPDGSRIVTASGDKTARIWDAATTKEIVVLRGHDDRLQSAAFSRDGSRIVTASADRTARIWEAATAKEIAALRGHDDGVWSAAFSPDGSRIVTTSGDGTARIWDTAKEIAVLRGHDVLVWSAALAKNPLYADWYAKLTRCSDHGGL